jgi:hypothetical protein
MIVMALIITVAAAARDTACDTARDGEDDYGE